MNKEFINRNIFSISKDIRYAAIYVNDRLVTSERDGLENASSSESDKYEELIVNPTLLKLVTQRGNIDCGGADHVLIKYGSFYELVVPLRNGHLSVGMELGADVMKLINDIVNPQKMELLNTQA